MADEVQTFKALITIHKVLQEGHPVTVKEAQQNVNWVESLARGVNGEGLRGKNFTRKKQTELHELRTWANSRGITHCIWSGRKRGMRNYILTAVS